MAELAISDVPDTVYHLPGLGSCVAVALFDEASTVTGVAHIMLPDSQLARPGDGLAKFADTGITRLVEGMVRLGGRRDALRAKLAGGAEMFRIAVGLPSIGRRNADAILGWLGAAAIGTVAMDLGGSRGRSVRFHAGSRQLVVRLASNLEKVL
jgi:chemotaxis protein CheD